MAVSMGIGELGKPGVIIKRKFRYFVSFEKNNGEGNGAGTFVKSAQRPTLEIDETELNYMNGYMTIPGKGKWQPITITYYDVAKPDNLKEIYNWIAETYDYTKDDGYDIKQSEKGSGNSGWSRKGIITMYDGCGNELEVWTLYDCWPQSINFGDLDYSSSEEATFELTVKYRYAKLERKCEGTISATCTGC